jgi:hypothetical protein
MEIALLEINTADLLSLDCIDVYPGSQSASLGAAVNFVRLEWSFVSLGGATPDTTPLNYILTTWGFRQIGPFWYQHLIAACGLKGTVAVLAGLTVACSIVPVAALQITAYSRRNKGQTGP